MLGCPLSVLFMSANINILWFFFFFFFLENAKYFSNVFLVSASKNDPALKLWIQITAFPVIHSSFPVFSCLREIENCQN
jgi:hypothetical protein